MSCEADSVEASGRGICGEDAHTYCDDCSAELCDAHLLLIHVTGDVWCEVCSSCATKQGHTVYECETCGKQSTTAAICDCPVASKPPAEWDVLTFVRKQKGRAA